MKLLFTLLSILLLVGCTITKRHFGPGYHVEWKKSHSKEGNEAEKTNLSDLRENVPEEAETDLKDIAPAIDSIDLSSLKIEPKEEFETDKTVSNQSNQDEVFEPIEVTGRRIQKKPLSEKEEPEIEIRQRTEPLTWVSLILLFVAGIALGIIAAYGSILFVGAGILITCLMIAMFVCSLISVIRIRRDPNRYKNKGLTHFLFALSFICLITAALYLIVIGALASMTPMLQGI